MEANAHLLAAAPDLERELSHLVRVLEPLVASGAFNIPGLATLNGARAALAKARGERNGPNRGIRPRDSKGAHCPRLIAGANLPLTSQARHFSGFQCRQEMDFESLEKGKLSNSDLNISRSIIAMNYPQSLTKEKEKRQWAPPRRACQKTRCCEYRIQFTGCAFRSFWSRTGRGKPMAEIVQLRTDAHPRAVER